MNWVIVYFTRTGNCERIAKRLAEMTAYPLIRLTDDVNWSGVFGFIKAGFYALTGKRTNIKLEGELNADRIVLITPIWAGFITPAARSFLDHFDPSKVLLVTVSEITKPQEVYRSLKRKYNLLGIHGFNRSIDEDEAMKQLIEKLQRL